MQFGDELDAKGPEGDLFRRKLSKDLKSQEKLISSSGTLLGYRYEGSPIVIPDGTKEPEDNPRTYLPIARPGHRAPHIWIEEGVSILDKFSAGFTLLKFKPCDTAELEKSAFELNFPLSVISIDNNQAAKLYEYSMVLVRPDLMIAWRSNELPSRPVEFLDRLRGA